MITRVITEGTQTELEACKSALTFKVEQANARELINPQPYCILSAKRIVRARVPACVMSVTSQTSEEAYLMLISCYEACITMAVSAGAKLIFVKPLGVGVKLTRVIESGESIPDGLWGNLFWTQSKSASAARLAVENLKSISEEVMVVFSVPQEALSDWDFAPKISS